MTIRHTHPHSKCRERLSISQAPDSHQSLSFTPMSTGVSGSGDDHSYVVGISDNLGLIAVMAGALLQALALVGLVPLMVIVIIIWRRKRKHRICNVPPTDGGSSG